MNIIDFLNSRKIIWFPVIVDTNNIRGAKRIAMDINMPPGIQHAIARINRHNMLSLIIEKHLDLMKYVSLDDLKQAQSMIDSYDNIGIWVDSRYHIHDIDNPDHGIDLSSVCYHESINRKLPHIFIKGDIQHRHSSYSKEHPAKYACSDLGEHFQGFMSYVKKDAIVQNPDLFVLE